MSLINDALKRTKQNQQQPGSKPASPFAGTGAGAPLQPAREQQSGSNSMIWIGLAVVLIVAGFWLFPRSSTKESLPSAPSRNVIAVQADPTQPATPIEKAAQTGQKWANRQEDATPVKPAANPAGEPRPSVAAPSIAPKPEPRGSVPAPVVAEAPVKTPAPAAVQPAPVAESLAVATPSSPSVAPAPSVAITPVPPEVKTGNAIPTPAPASAAAVTSTSSVTPPPASAAVTAATPTASPAVEQPAVAAAAPPPVLPEMKLQGIFYRLKKPSALINGRTVGIGDDVDGARVVAIERQSVKLMFAGKSTVLTLR